MPRAGRDEQPIHAAESGHGPSASTTASSKSSPLTTQTSPLPRPPRQAWHLVRRALVIATVLFAPLGVMAAPRAGRHARLGHRLQHRAKGTEDAERPATQARQPAPEEHHDSGDQRASAASPDSGNKVGVKTKHREPDTLNVRRARTTVRRCTRSGTNGSNFRGDRTTQGRPAD